MAETWTRERASALPVINEKEFDYAWFEYRPRPGRGHRKRKRLGAWVARYGGESWAGAWYQSALAAHVFNQCLIRHVAIARSRG